MLLRRIAILFVLTCTLCLAQPAPRASSVPGNTYALLLQGISRDPVDRATKDQALNTLRGFLLERARVDPSRLAVLQARDDPSQADDRGPETRTAAFGGPAQPTADNLRRALNAFASKIQPQDRFFCWYIGHANVVGGRLRLNLPGPDITDKDLADRLRALAAKSQVLVLDCPYAGCGAKTLTAEGRIIVCAATAEQAYATQFTSQFVQVLSRPAADTDGDGKLSLLEAFTATARKIEEGYRQQQILATETPCLEDNGDGVPSEQPWRYRTEKGDGAGAAAFVLVEGH
jgi:hypothetical protein